MNTTPLTPPDFIAKPRPQRRRRQVVSSPPPPVALTLVSAGYELGDPSTLELAFDRAIDIAGLDGAAIVVDDPNDSAAQWNATGGAAMVNATTVLFTLEYLGDATGTELRMNASAGTGIVASDDGGMWAGVTELGLPWP